MILVNFTIADIPPATLEIFYFRDQGHIWLDDSKTPVHPTKGSLIGIKLAKCGAVMFTSGEKKMTKTKNLNGDTKTW